MPDFVRISSNFVNLGRLYSRPPGYRPARNFVNLGDLYKSPRHRAPTGWAFFEDGSVFINPKTYLEHSAFEAQMKLLQPFVRGPSPNLERVRSENPEWERLVIIAKAKNPDTYSVLARNAREGQRIVVEKAPFEKIDFQLGGSGSYILSATFHRDLKWPSLGHRGELQTAFSTFRGTLIDGVLQPNVRLGNGLQLSANIRFDRRSLPPAEMEFKSNMESTLDKDSIVPRNGRLSRTSSGKASLGDSASFSHRASSRREADLNRRERELLYFQKQLLFQLRSLRGRSTPPQKRRSFSIRKISVQYDNSARYARPKRTEQGDADRKIAETHLKARERQHSEEILEWKRRYFDLQLKLALAEGAPLPEYPEEYSEEAHAMGVGNAPSGGRKSPSASEVFPKGFPETNAQDPFSVFGFQGPSPSQSSEYSATRIMLPRKKSRRKPLSPHDSSSDTGTKQDVD